MSKLRGLEGTFRLHNGVEMPYFGLGTYKADNDEEVVNSVRFAIDHGYRHIDTAAVYGNEQGVGRGIRESRVDRDQLFVVSKVWNSDQGYESTLKAFHDTLGRLNVDYLDLYLIHWPVAGKYKETWRALEKLYREKKIRSIGVSNFMIHHLEDLATESEILPMVNQVEFHPYLIQQPLLEYCKQHGIQYEGWSPFMQGKIFKRNFAEEIIEKYDKSAAQIVLRWNLQKGVVVIPKSVHEERIISNADIFDFELTSDEMESIDRLDQNERSGPDPDNFDF